MITIRKSSERGHFDRGWLDTRHTFSFADYHDPAHMGFRSLRVINEDEVSPGEGFGTHPHRDMEIVTYVTSGRLRHEDSSGGGGVLRAGEVQHMSAGTGVRHSEMNDSVSEPVHLFQTWILPDRAGLEPEYQQACVPAADKQGRLRVVAGPPAGSGEGVDQSSAEELDPPLLPLHQDASLLIGDLDIGQEMTYELRQGRGAWIQVVRGKVTVNDQSLSGGDGAAVEDEDLLLFHALEPTEVMLFDLA